MSPRCLRLLPPALRLRAYYWFCYGSRSRRPERFAAAPLAFAPAVRMRLHPTDEGHGQIAFTGFYELELTRRLVVLARRGGLLVDVGANYGYFSLLWAARRNQNRVIAFEASPRNLSALRENVVRNGLDGRIEIRGLAIGREGGILPFTLGPEEQTGWGGLSLQPGRTVEVEVTTLDQALASVERIDVLKIDVEGADTWVLMGAQGLLGSKRIANVYFELNRERLERLGIGDREVMELLQEMGYVVTALGDEAGDVVEYHAAPRIAGRK